MPGIQTGIQLDDQFTSVMYGILNCVNMANAQMAELSGAMNQDIDTAGWEAIQSEISQATILMDELAASLDDTSQPINRNIEAQERFNREVKNGVQDANQLNAVISKVGGALLGGAVVKKAMNWIEDCTDAFDTQRKAEIQLMTVLGNMLDEDYVAQFEVSADISQVDNDINGVQARADALQTEFDSITKKASEIQSRGIYGDEVMIAGAAEFSTYFSDSEAIEMMMDTLADYAMGMSGVGELDSTAMVDYATGLGKIMAGSYEAMTKKGFKFAEAQKAVIEGTATQEEIIAAIGDEYLNASQDVQAAAAINAVVAESWDGLYESMSNTPQGQIIQMTNAWGDMKEVIGGQLYPFVLRFVRVITENWPTIQVMLNNISMGLQVMMWVLSTLVEAGLDFAQVITDNWSWISPIIYGIAGAMAVYYGWLLLTKGAALATAAAQAILTGAKMLAVPVYAALTGATMAETAAQWGLNSAMYACPIVWIIVLIIVLIAALVALCNWIAEVTGVADSGIGIIVGSLAVAGAFIGNLFVALINMAIDIFVVFWNFIAAFVNFFGNVFTDPVGAIARLFFDLVDCILGLLQTLAGAIDALFGSDLAGAVQGWRDDLGNWVDETFGHGEEIMAKVSSEDWHVDRFDYGDAWNAGVAVGDGISSAIDNFSLTDLFDAGQVPPVDDYASSFGNEMAGDMGDIAWNTGSIKDSLDCTEEDLRYLRDIAEQETVNRFTTAEIHIEMNNTNTINSGDDIDGFITKLTDSVNEAVDSMAEGVHE